MNRVAHIIIVQAKLDQEFGVTGILKDTEITLDLPDATDATTSADGQVLIIRLYVGAFLYPRRMDRPDDVSLVDILRDETECLVSVGMQRQGESVALNPDGTSYFTHSEHVNQPIWRYDILE